MDQVTESIQFMRASIPALRPGAELANPALTQAPAPMAEESSGDVDGLVEGQLDLLDRINVAAAILNREERLVQLNRRCERLLGTSLTRQRERLVAKDRRSNERLKKALRAAFSFNGIGLQPDAGCGLIVREAEPPILFRALPLGRPSLDSHPSYALLMFSAPQLRSVAAAGLLARAFDLTPAQARLARQLATGASLDTAAARLGVKKETVRNHLKQVFLRTGTCRQGELVALLSSFWLAAAEEE